MHFTTRVLPAVVASALVAAHALAAEPAPPPRPAM